jgi:hypothetical protein
VLDVLLNLTLPQSLTVIGAGDRPKNGRPQEEKEDIAEAEGSQGCRFLR